MKRWKSEIDSVSAVLFRFVRLLEYLYSAVWEFWKTCPPGSFFAVFSRKMGKGYFFHRLSTGAGGGIFPFSKNEVCAGLSENDFSQNRRIFLFHGGKQDVQRGFSQGFGKNPHKFQWKTITFPQVIPQGVEKLFLQGENGYFLISRRMSLISFSRLVSVFSCFSTAVMLE